MTLGVEVRLLGSVSLLVDGQPVPVPGARQRVALAALALAPGGTVSSEALADYLWGDAQPTNVRPALHTTITRLRKLVGTDRVVSTPSGYALVVPDDAVDVRRFRSLVAVARQAQDPDAEASLLQEARGLWRGEALDGVDSQRLLTEHALPLTEEWFAATERLIDLRLTAGDHGDLTGDLRGLISRYPLRESLWARLIRALAASGRQAEALDAYQEIRTQLLDQLGMDPGQELVATHAAVLAGTAGPELGDARTSVPRQLPTDAPSFVGREEQLRILDELAAGWSDDPAHRAVIVVLDGAGGMGKTALAVRWGHRAASTFADGQLYVNLRGYGPGNPVDPFAVAGAMLGALGAVGEQIPADPEARFAQLRTALAERNVLLVLDNARDAEQVRPLLPGSAAFVLVTSRNQLRGLVSREGAHRITVAELSEAASVGLLGQAASGSTTAEVREVADLCARVPLALAVAGERLARAPGGRVDDVLAELRDEQERLDALSSGDDLTSDVRVVLSWSYQTLDAEESRLFRLLPLAPGPDITPSAAAALVDRPVTRTRRLLDRLVASHLLLEKEPGRFELHDLVRVYAAELVGADEAARRRVLSWYRATALVARQLTGTRQPLVYDAEPGVVPLALADAASAMAWLDDERTNLLDVVDDAAAAGLDTLAWQVAAALSMHSLARRPWAQPLAQLERGLACARRSGDRFGEAIMLAAIGDAHHYAQRFEESVALTRQALEVYREIEDLRGQVGMLTNIGGTLELAGRSEEAIEQHLHAVEACEALDDPGAMALVLNNLAAAYNAVGRHDAAAGEAQRALEMVAGDELREADVLDELGLAHAGRGEHDEAVANFQGALDRYRAAGHPMEVATLHHLARTQRAAGDKGAARETWRRAASLATDLGDPLAVQIRAELAAL